MEPTIGRMVHYTLSEIDAKLITGRRVHSGLEACNAVNVGDTFPAVIVRAFGGTAVNLQVLLDGEDTYWACSRMLSATAGVPGTWSWPPLARGGVIPNGGLYPDYVGPVHSVEH